MYVCSLSPLKRLWTKWDKYFVCRPWVVGTQVRYETSHLSQKPKHFKETFKKVQNVRQIRKKLNKFDYAEEEGSKSKQVAMQCKIFFFYKRIKYQDWIS